MRKKHFRQILKYGFQVSIVLIMIGIFVFSQIDIFKRRTVVSFFDVGQGDATHIRSGGTDVLIDGGRSNSVLERLGDDMPFFDRSIELMVLTHPDFDHHFGLLETVRRYSVSTILETHVACHKELCESWESLIRTHHRDIAHAGLSYEIDHGKIDVLFPFTSVENQEIENINDTSIVLCVTVYNSHFLLMGDAEAAVEKELIDRNALGACDQPDVLKAGHHGSKSSSSEIFIAHLNPKYVILSAGLRNDYGHPHYEVLERLKKYHAAVYRTDLDGTIRFVFDGEQMNIHKDI